MVDEPTKDCGVTDASWVAATLSGCKRAPATLLEWLPAFDRSFRSASVRVSRCVPAHIACHGLDMAGQMETMRPFHRRS